MDELLIEWIDDDLFGEAVALVLHGLCYGSDPPLGEGLLTLFLPQLDCELFPVAAVFLGLHLNTAMAIIINY